MGNVTSPTGRAMIASFEGLRLTAYQDIVGVWTIGYGHTGPDVKPGLAITRQQADQLLVNDLARFERGVNALVTVRLEAEALPLLEKLDLEFEQSEFLVKGKALQDQVKTTLAQRTPGRAFSPSTTMRRRASNSAVMA